ncbi:DNA polymerase I [Aquabacterium fontiphilum]|uniref:DNA polymerase I n=1 Tax=Aquabacterium fontiphilum TaxID=450365 RepID=UPI0013778803|nr:DNA polymerase I [Aquabacterium fontiphilum]NBD20225.1 DNA polymerase I [Aquabacterium fontiphilum]
MTAPVSISESADAAALPTLLLVDGSSYLYRAFHAMPDLRGPNGEATGAIHGMVNMLGWIRDHLNAEHAVCVFDAKGPTFRDAWYPEYKAHRPPMPDDLRSQIEPIHEVVKLLGWPVLEVPGIEADDAIGTLARVGVASGHKVVISTGDKDMAQLVNGRVSLINTMAKPPEVLDEAGVLAKFGVPPERIIDYLTLIGDAVDNVPGVEKVGPKTAAKWIAEHGSLEGVMAAAASIKGVAGENLRKALDWLPQGRRLITVKCDCDLTGHVSTWPGLDALAMKAPDLPGLLDFYTRFGFRSARAEIERLLKGQAGASSTGAPVTVSGAAVAPGGTGDLFADPPAPHTLPEAACVTSTCYDTILTWADFERWLARIRAAELVAFDTETDSLESMRARIVGLSFSDKVGEACYIPLRHEGPDAPEQLPLDEVLARLKPWFEDELRPKLGQHIKYDTHVLANHGITVRGYRHDTMLESYVLEAHRKHNLGDLALRYVGRAGLSYEDVAGKGAQQIPFAQVAVDRAAQYSCEDSDLTLAVHQALWPQLQAEPGLKDIYERFEMPTSRVLQRIERNGVLIDKALLQQQSHELAQRIMALEQEAYALAGQPFNLASPKQLGEILFVKQGLPVVKKTATGAPSTNEEVLEKLAEDHPLPARILEHRSLAKLKSTYTDKLPLMINPDTGRVHTNYAQAVAVTGRLASNDPNLQNIPVRTTEGRRIREAFIAPPGHVIVSADYSQIELRIMAHISQDENLLRAFADGVDVHKATASEVFGVPVDEVSSEQRRYAKVINFGLIYGMSGFGLAQNLGIERSAANAYIERYFQRFAGVKRYMDDTRAQAKAQGYVETVFGRRLWLPEINSGNGPLRAGAERAAINAPMQGTAADLIKLAMVAVQDTLDAEGRASKIIMQVHDELVLEVPEAELDWVKAAVPRMMASVATLRVPLLAEVGAGPNWEAAH